MNFNFKREQCFETLADNFDNFHEAIYIWKVLLKKQRFSEEFDANDDVEGALDHVDHVEHFENYVDDDVDDAVDDADEHIGNYVNYAVGHIEKYVDDAVDDVEDDVEDGLFQELSRWLTRTLQCLHSSATSCLMIIFVMEMMRRWGYVDVMMIVIMRTIMSKISRLAPIMHFFLKQKLQN